MGEGTNRADEASGTWGEDEAKIFAEFGRAMVPGREELERTLLHLIPAEPDEPFLGVEIGTGAGWLSAAVLREFSKAKILGLDGSAEMLMKAAQLLGHYGDRAELRRLRLEEPSWADGLPTVRVFLSSLVFHHLDGSGKRDLFVRLFDRLEPGGAAVRRRDGASQRARQEPLRRGVGAGDTPPLGGNSRRCASL